MLPSICIFSPLSLFSSFFFFNDTATTEIYTLSLHDALPILAQALLDRPERIHHHQHQRAVHLHVGAGDGGRSEEHTSELQSRRDLVCRLLLEKKKKKIQIVTQEIY